MPRRAGRQQVLQAVYEAEAPLTLAQVFQFAVPDEAKTIAVEPRVTKRELQVVIDLFEAQLVTQDVLVQVARDCKYGILLAIERFPEYLPTATIGAYKRLAARVGPALMDAVHWRVREKRRFRGHPAGRQSAGRRHKQPVIGIRCDADEERRHPVDIANGVIPLAVNRQEFSRHVGGTRNAWTFGNVQHVSSIPRVSGRQKARHRSSRGPSDRSEPTRSQRNFLLTHCHRCRSKRA